MRVGVREKHFPFGSCWNGRRGYLVYQLRQMVKADAASARLIQQHPDYLFQTTAVLLLDYSLDQSAPK